MTTKIAIQTDVGGGSLFVTEHLNSSHIGAYRYSGLSDALKFKSINAALSWIERAAFYSGKKGKSYSGSPRLVRIEVATPTPQFRVVGPVE